MLYEITVIDTDEHPPSTGSSWKWEQATDLGKYLVEAPAPRRFQKRYGDHVESQYRMPKAVIETALDVAAHHLSDATHNKTVLVQVGYVRPKRVGYGTGNTLYTQTGALSTFLLNSEYLKRRGEPEYIKILSTLD